MNPSDQSLIQQERIEQSIRERYSPFPELTMDRLSQTLNAFRVGDLRSAARIWDIMLERDGELQGVFRKRCSDTSRLGWEITTEDDSPEAARHADALKYAYGKLRTTDALDRDMSGGVRTLISQMMSAHAHRYSAHEMKLRVDNAGAKQVTLELTHCPVYWFEARRGRLAFLESDGHRDGIALEEGKWLRAVGHGFMRQCSVAYLVKWSPLSSWLLYTHRFGLPGIHAETDATPNSKEWNDFAATVLQWSNDLVFVTNRGAKVNLLQASSAADAPFAPLVEYTDRLYAKLFRGGDLSTNSKDNQAVGASGQNEERDAILMDDAAWITDVLNEQIDRPFIRYMFGTEPKAWFRLNPPKRAQVDSDIKGATFLVERGVRISAHEAAERLGWCEADEGEPALTASASPPAPDPINPLALANSKDALAAKAIEQIAKETAGDLAPLRARLDAVMAMEDMGARQTELMSIIEDIPDFAQRVLKLPSAAKPLGDLLGTAYVNGLLKSKR